MRLQPWKLTKATVTEFFNDGALADGAAIAFYTITSIGPVLFIVVAIAGLAFGEPAARGAISGELASLMGRQAADLLETLLSSAKGQTTGILATLFGFVTLIITASGVFTQMQATLNRIWKASPSDAVVTELVRVRIISLGLVAALGFLLLVSLVISAALAALSNYVDRYWPFAHFMLQGASFLASYALIAVMFAAIYKVLPDKEIEWHDVIIGALVTALLFTIGKFLIGLYIGNTAVASSYGAAGSLMVVLLWIYYSAQIFLVGAEFTKVYAYQHGSRARSDSHTSQ